MSRIAIRDLKRTPSRAVSQETVDGLARSILEIGLLQPILVDGQNRVLAGEHRIRAFEKLHKTTGEMKWLRVPVNVVDLADARAELATLDENLVRNEGTALERGDSLKRRKELYETLHPEARHGHAGAEAKHGRAADTVSFAADTAAKAGLSERTVQRHVQVAENLDAKARATVEKTPIADSITDLEQLSRLAPKQQREVAKRAAKTGESVKRAAKAIRKAEQIEQVRAYVPPAGEFPVVVEDPAWPFEDELEGDGARGGLPYPAATIEDICALKVPMAKDCIHLLWVTNAHLLDGSAHRVLAARGVTPKALLTWVKPKIGLGRWLRNRTEHCILSIRGKPKVDLTNQSTVLEAPVGEHSEKPQAFYDLIEKLCPARPLLELNARRPRKGWETSGAEIDPAEGERRLVEDAVRAAHGLKAAR